MQKTPILTEKIIKNQFSTKKIPQNPNFQQKISKKSNFQPKKNRRYTDPKEWIGGKMGENGEIGAFISPKNAFLGLFSVFLGPKMAILHFFIILCLFSVFRAEKTKQKTLKNH
jgi:hypothetical protein